jgi:hypothetical protein
VQLKEGLEDHDEINFAECLPLLEYSKEVGPLCVVAVCYVLATCLCLSSNLPVVWCLCAKF